tara:strand:+ start:979 stop:1674 length:696 start_codon:yes stop_codon:yes gene_type:complete
MKIKNAIILAAGFGKRLNPLTLTTPKPLLKIGDITILENTINFLKNYGIQEIIINTFYLSEQIVSFLNKLNLEIKITSIVEKKEILGTGGGIVNAAKLIKQDCFFVINPDTIWSQPYLKELEQLEKNFFEQKLDNALLLVNKSRSFDTSLKGDFNLDRKGMINFESPNDFIYTGCQIFEKKVFNSFSAKPFPINLIWEKLIKDKKIGGVESKEDFLHLTSIKIYNDLTKKY